VADTGGQFINLEMLAKWIMSYAIGCVLAVAFLIVMSPLAFVSMIGSGFLGFWILYNLSVVPIAFGASSLQALTLPSLRPHRLAWVFSATFGWLAAAVLALNLPEMLHMDVLAPPILLSLWLGGGLFAGFLQWATVLRSSKGLIWMVVSTGSILLIPAVWTILYRLAIYASAIFPPDPARFSAIWIAALAFSLLALLGIGLVSIASYAVAMGLTFAFISSDRKQ
jgi:hypothetical protein